MKIYNRVKNSQNKKFLFSIFSRVCFRSKFSFWLFLFIFIFLCSNVPMFQCSNVLAWTPPQSPPPQDNVPQPLNTGPTAQGKTGNLGIGTTSPGTGIKLDVLGIIESTAAITSGGRITGTEFYDGVYYLDPGSSDISLYVLGSIMAVGTASDNYFLGSVGIGVSSPDTLLTIANDSWISSKDNAGTGHVNMFKVNASDEIDVGATLNIGPIELEEDSGAITLVNLPVSSTPSDGDTESYGLSIDSNPVLTIYGLADGTGGTDTHRVGIGTTVPQDKLHVDGDYVTFDITGVAANRILATADSTGRAYWKDLSDISGVTGPGIATDNAIARFDGATGKIIQNSSVFIDDDGYVGIVTDDPVSALSIGVSNQFQVNSSGAIIAATGITSSGTITFSGMSSAGFVKNDASGVLSGGNSIIAGDLPGSFSGFANPSTTIGLATVNGTATTAMRSDAAPALSQSIMPTWTGAHTFSNTVDFDGDVLITDTNIALDGASTNLNVTGNFSINTDDIYVRKSDGNVGIGTTSFLGTQTKMQVSGGDIYLEDGVFDDPKDLVTVDWVGSAIDAAILSGDSDWLYDSDPMTKVYNTDINVGIGTTTPNAKLQVKAAVAEAIVEFTDDDGTDVMQIDANGNVIISL